MFKRPSAAITALFAFATVGVAAADSFHVEPNKTKPLRVRTPVASVAVGNPEIADISVHDANLILVTGRTFGRTNLILFDGEGRQIYAADLVVSDNAPGNVTIARAGQTQTYDCAPQCRPLPGLDGR